MNHGISTILGHVQRPSMSRLRAGVFAKTTSFQPGDGSVVASREDGRGPCSEAGRDAAAPLYGRLPHAWIPHADTSRARGGFSRAKSISTSSSCVLAFSLIRLRPRRALQRGRRGKRHAGGPVDAKQENYVAPDLADSREDSKPHEFCFGGKQLTRLPPLRKSPIHCREENGKIVLWSPPRPLHPVSSLVHLPRLAARLLALGS
jgi:hypothetical protein